MPITPNEELVTLRHAAEQLPPRRLGKRPHVSCLYRWTTQGCRGVILESINVGATRCTSREALTRFMRRLSVANAKRREPAHAPASREKHLRQVEETLDKAGI